ncbi:MAG: hypothetical protein IJI20_07645 [Firmicutes bacterium]|nr:hypothetical protein [Bacillota bacterium]
MGVFDDLGVYVPGLSEEDAEEFVGETEEIFRFDVFITPEQEIEIGVNVMELSVEGVPDFGEQYSFLAHTFVELVTEHIGMNTEILMNAVAELPALDVKLTAEEEAILQEEGTGDNGAMLLYSFPVLIMADDEDGDGEFGEDEMQLGCGFEKSPKAEVMAKVYGDDYLEQEDMYQDAISDAVLDHGILFVKAVESIQKL